MIDASHIGPHEYSFREGIFCFTPRGPVLPEHATQLVELFQKYGGGERPLGCLFDLTASPSPTPAARRIVVAYFRSARPRLIIATHGASLPLRAMVALVASATRVLAGYDLNVTHCSQREEAWEYLRRALAG